MTGNLCSHNRTLTPRTQPAIGFFAAGSGGGSARAIMLSTEQSVDWKTKDRSACATLVLPCVSFAFVVLPCVSFAFVVLPCVSFAFVVLPCVSFAFVFLTCRTAMTLGRRTAAQVYARRLSTSGATLHVFNQRSAAWYSHDWQALKRKSRTLTHRGFIARRSGALMCMTSTSCSASW